MSSNPLVFYVSVDNILSCKYYLTKNEITNYVLSSGNLKEFQSQNLQIDIEYTSPCIRHTVKEVMNNNIKQINSDQCDWYEKDLKSLVGNLGAKDRQIRNVSCLSEDNNDTNSQVILVHMPLPILIIKPFVMELEKSKCYRRGAHNNMNKLLANYVGESCDVRLILNVYSKDSYQIDYAWGLRMWRQIRLAIERECAAAWLSTLGGAFSALGEQSDKCAKMALKISLQQIKLSADSGDPDGVARGWLFMALGLSQLGHGNVAFRLVSMAKAAHSYDDRHHTMCLGVEAKLKYDRKVRKQRRAKGILQSPDSLEKVLKAMLLQ